MKIKSENTAKTSMIYISLLMVIKTLFTQPLYNKLPFLGYSGAYDIQSVSSAVGAVIFSVLVSIFLIKTAERIGENATPLILLAVAEPLLISTVSSLFHALAAIITIVWIAFSITSKNKIVIALVSVVSAAVISFIMPNAIFSYIILGIIVTFFAMWDSSKFIGIISAAASGAVSVILVSVMDIETRMNIKVSGMFYKFGGYECNPLSFANISYAQELSDILSRFGKAAVASIPVIAAVIFIAVAIFGYKADYTDNKKSSETVKKENILMVIALTVPYVFALLASMVCTGVSGIMGFNIVPVIIILALAIKGNKAVAYALAKLNAFTKEHPVVSVIALVWLAAGTVEFAIETRLFDYTTQFIM